MERFNTLINLPKAARGASVAIGNFDGVHLGHQAVIETARRAGGPLGVLTFEPHPRAYFSDLRGAAQPSFRLMNADARAHRLAKLGVDLLFEAPFDAALAALTPEAFVNGMLADQIGAQHVVVGQDFCFGKDRAGTTDMLRDLCAARRINVTLAEMVSAGTIEVSSTNIRQALSDGKPGEAARMLGHWHRIEGPVIHGEKRGRTLGYPTANMSIAGLHPPAFGVYAVMVDVLDGPNAGSYHGAASIGVRPMFGVNTANCETYIFDFTGDLYGATVSVGLVEYLRGEQKFDGLEALTAQMAADCDQARSILAQIDAR